MEREDYNQLTGEIIGCAIEVHRIMGPGLLESVYQTCLVAELKKCGLNVEEHVMLSVNYQDQKLEKAYFIDLLVEDAVILELKSVESVAEVHVSQILSYMKLGQYKVGILLNFNVRRLKDGIHRFVNHF